MRWTPRISLIFAIFLLGADSSSSETYSDHIEMLQFRSQTAPNTEPIKAVLHGAEQFEVSWRLQEMTNQKLFISSDNTAYYQVNDQWKSVLPSGERLPIMQSSLLPEPVNTPISINFKVTEGSLSLLDNLQTRWTYSLPGTNQIRPSSLQYDASEHIYFQDTRGSWYSLDQTGKERYKLILQDQDNELVCRTAPSGDAFCTSPQLGIFAIREKTNAPRLILDGKERFFTQKPQIMNDRTLVPLRSIFEAMQAKVDWNEDSQTVIATKGNRTIKLTLNNDMAYLNGKKIQLDAPPVLYQQSMYVPLRFVGESLGATVIWENATRTIQIIS
ncbi:copper amine oxidase N-terminal domain-containing protein [Paenibacillus roseipurpureus]|uniref:Copper amine oxidase N-terminal domain-containing protein n=1 Tax=Paenibacillus roseopurpureus TaxID=2918901 RepID=A0AA96LJW7_9BACL|nr:copper amine oxidase N-terminal domain-containing protein [Paenibacillus sp. MBLB1832]WNR42338.1 copper amine oxidase N-terminal domain-containing protein [Paenibacillus sp. MBLB1832]